MPSPTSWFCGHCQFGPMTIGIHEHCVICFRQRDVYARYEALKTSSTNARAAVRLPPTAHPSASKLESLPLDTFNLQSSPTTLAYQGETPRDSIARCGRQTTGFHSNSNVLGRLQTFCCPQAATTKWFCCQCGDGPKTTDIEVKCLGCEHPMCDNCSREG